MNKDEKKHAIREIKRLWNKCESTLNNKGWSKYGDELLRLCRTETQGHNRFRGDSIKRGLTITEEAKFFSVQRLLNYVYELADYIPSLDDYHHTQKSVFIAYSLANEFQNEIKERVTLEEAQYINKLDYCKLINDGFEDGLNEV